MFHSLGFSFLNIITGLTEFQKYEFALFQHFDCKLFLRIFLTLHFRLAVNLSCLMDLLYELFTSNLQLSESHQSCLNYRT